MKKKNDENWWKNKIKLRKNDEKAAKKLAEKNDEKIPKNGKNGYKLWRNCKETIWVKKGKKKTVEKMGKNRWEKGKKIEKERIMVENFPKINKNGQKKKKKWRKWATKLKKKKNQKSEKKRQTIENVYKQREKRRTFLEKGQKMNKKL